MPLSGSVLTTTRSSACTRSPSTTTTPAGGKAAPRSHCSSISSIGRLCRSRTERLEAACAEATVLMMAKYDTRNPEALRRLVAAGVQLRQFPRPVLDACYKAAFETYDELAGR